MKSEFIYLLSSPKGNMQLYQFVIIFGGLILVLAQIPSFHSLRHINLVSLILCFAYSGCTTAGSIYIRYSKNAHTNDYLVTTSGENRVFGIFNAISIIVVTYASGIIPEIQATIAPPVQRKMFKGLCICYAVIEATFFGAGISGYWPFGNQAMGTVLANFMAGEKYLEIKRDLIFQGNTLITVVSLVLGVVGTVSSFWQIVLGAKTFHLFANM